MYVLYIKCFNIIVLRYLIGWPGVSSRPLVTMATFPFLHFYFNLLLLLLLKWYTIMKGIKDTRVCDLYVSALCRAYW